MLMLVVIFIVASIFTFIFLRSLYLQTNRLIVPVLPGLCWFLFYLDITSHSPTPIALIILSIILIVNFLYHCGQFGVGRAFLISLLSPIIVIWVLITIGAINRLFENLFGNRN